MAKDIDIKVSGETAVLKGIQKNKTAWDRAVVAAVYQKGLSISADAVRLTPVDTGRLRASHYVAPPRGPDNEVEIGFGTNYAIPVHERTDVRHEVGQAKFLQTAVQKGTRGYRQDIRRRAQDNFKRGIGVTSVPASAPERPRGGGDG